MIYQIPDLDVIGGLCVLSNRVYNIVNTFRHISLPKDTSVNLMLWQKSENTAMRDKKKVRQLQSHVQFKSQWRAGCVTRAGPQSLELSIRAGGVLSGQCGSASLSPHYSPRLLATTCQATLVVCLVTCPGPPYWQPAMLYRGLPETPEGLQRQVQAEIPHQP